MSRRRTLLPTDTLNVSNHDLVDDEAEKRVRVFSEKEHTNSSIRIFGRGGKPRHDSDQNRTPSTPTFITGPSTSHTNPTPLPKASNEQLSCLYNNCIKLLNENKINSKNAFQLKLIDYLSDIVLSKEINGGTDTNFQVVGCTIDAGSKIYAARVDALHQNTYQMLSGLGHQNNDNDEAMQDVEAPLEGDDEAAGDRPAAKKRKRAKKSSHISENLDAITTKCCDDLMADEDLYFAKISSAIEQEAIEGLLVNKLKFKNDSLELLIDRDDIYYEVNKNDDSEIGVENRTVEDDGRLAELARTISGETLKICEDLSAFHFIGWNVDSSENDEFSSRLNQITEDLSRAYDITGDGGDEELEAHRFDNNLNAIDELQMHANNELMTSLVGGGDMHGVDLDDMDVDVGAGPGGMLLPEHQLNASKLNIIDDLRSMTSIAELTSLVSSASVASEYSYFSFDKVKLHDLPRHLKTIAMRLRAVNVPEGDGVLGGSSVRSTGDRRRKEVPKIDVAELVDRSKFFKMSKKAIFLSDKTIEKRSEKIIFLESEREFDYNARQLLQPFFKKITAKMFSSDADLDNLLIESVESPKVQGAPIGGDDDEVAYDGLHMSMGGGEAGAGDSFALPATQQLVTQEFFSQGGAEFEMYTQMPHADMGSLSEAPAMLDGEFLVKAPEQVNALNIEYAKTAKYIDAKRLKHVLWSLIYQLSNLDKENDESLSNVSDFGELADRQSSKKINCTLSSVYALMKPPLINQRTYDDLSVSIVFQMLLFLANEHNLRLIHSADGSDVQITNAAAAPSKDSN